jgi:hypothetical protein
VLSTGPDARSAGSSTGRALGTALGEALSLGDELGASLGRPPLSGERLGRSWEEWRPTRRRRNHTRRSTGRRAGRNRKTQTELGEELGAALGPALGEEADRKLGSSGTSWELKLGATLGGTWCTPLGSAQAALVSTGSSTGRRWVRLGSTGTLAGSVQPGTVLGPALGASGACRHCRLNWETRARPVLGAYWVQHWSRARAELGGKNSGSYWVGTALGVQY